MKAATIDRRAEIVQRGAALFDEKGYHQTSMDDIAQAVGVRKPTLYHYVASKDEILFWIHEDVIDPITNAHLERAESGLAASELLAEMIADVLALLDSRPGHARVFFEHFRELTEERQAIVRAKRERYMELVEDVVRAGVESGEFRAVDTRLATLSILGSCNWAYQWYRADGPLSTREIAAAFSDLATRGLNREETDGTGSGRRSRGAREDLG